MYGIGQGLGLGITHIASRSVQPPTTHKGVMKRPRHARAGAAARVGV
jgi:hypothetical protein